MLSKNEFLKILEQILSNRVLLEEEKQRLKNINENQDLLNEHEQITAEVLINKLDLKNINTVTEEDGYFKEFVNTIDNNEQENQTEIFYLLKGKQVSCLHILDTTETWRWLGGKEISIFIFKKQELEKITLNETNPCHTIEKGTLFGAKISNLEDDNDFSIVTCLCKPGFVLKEHYKTPSKEEVDILFKNYPELIKELTPKISNSNKNVFQSIIQFFTCCIGVKKNEEQAPLINSSHNSR